MRIKSTEILDTFAEAFQMSAARLIITAENKKWAEAAASTTAGFATSVIGCRCEVGIERWLSDQETPDRRCGVSLLLFAGSAKGVANRLVERIGQCVMTCPTTACFNGLEGGEKVSVGGKLRYFGDGHQGSKLLDGRKLWRVPVMEGEFLVEDGFGVQSAIGGGNILLLGESREVTLEAAEAAVEAMDPLPGIILPFPGGVVRSGSKPGSKYKALPASTNHAYCPTLKGVVDDSALPEKVNSVLEIVVNGLDQPAVEAAMRQGMQAAAREGLVQISAGNYGGNLGQYHLRLHQILEG